MIHGQEDVKCVVMVIPQSVATNATATGEIDTRGYDFAHIDVIQDTAAATGNNLATLTLSEGDTTASYATWSGSVGDTGWTIPNADTSNAKVHRISVDLRGQRKRYLKIELTTGGAATIIGATGYLVRAKVSPNTDALSGFGDRVNL